MSAALGDAAVHSDAAARPDASPPDGRPTRRRRRRGYRLWFVLPSLLLVVIFFGAPFIANLVFAFLRWTSYSSQITWDGLSNFRELSDLGVIGHAIKVTLIFAVISMTVQNTVGMLLAKALQRGGGLDTVFRSIFFLPVLFSPLAAGYIWAAALQGPGPIDSFISVFVHTNYAWLGHAGSALVLVGIIDGWKWSGLVTIVYIAGLNRIPVSLLEAARLDGANAWRRYWRIEFPLLVPAFTFNLVVTLVGSLSAIDVIFATTAGGPGNATQVLNAELYSQYSGGMFGSASALGLTITLLVILFAVPLIAWLRKREVQM